MVLSNKRARRAGIRMRRGERRGETTRIPAPRFRRGQLRYIRSTWRRSEIGTNRISCLGVWSKGSRREAPRANRSGETDWRQVHAGTA